MEVKIERIADNKHSTLGKLYIDGLGLCYTLEDAYHSKKIAGKTRIPPGRYQLGLRKVGGFHNRYQIDPRFRAIHRGMIEVLDVPNYKYILFHCGNTSKDTAGCILLGTNYMVRNPNTNNEEYTVNQSAKAYKNIYPVIAEAIAQGDEVMLNIDTL